MKFNQKRRYDSKWVEIYFWLSAVRAYYVQIWCAVVWLTTTMSQFRISRFSTCVLSSIHTNIEDTQHTCRMCGVRVCNVKYVRIASFLLYIYVFRWNQTEWRDEEETEEKNTDFRILLSKRLNKKPLRTGVRRHRKKERKDDEEWRRKIFALESTYKSRSLRSY